MSVDHHSRLKCGVGLKFSNAVKVEPSSSQLLYPVLECGPQTVILQQALATLEMLPTRRSYSGLQFTCSFSSSVKLNILAMSSKTCLLCRAVTYLNFIINTRAESGGGSKVSKQAALRRSRNNAVKHAGGALHKPSSDCAIERDKTTAGGRRRMLGKAPRAKK